MDMADSSGDGEGNRSRTVASFYFLPAMSFRATNLLVRFVDGRTQVLRSGRGLAMGELGTRQYQRRRRGAEAVALADRQAAGLDPPRQHADDPGRGRGRPGAASAEVNHTARNPGKSARPHDWD